MTQSSEKYIKSVQLGERHILYDAALIEHPDSSLFSPPREIQSNHAAGRGEAIFFRYQDLDLVLKHYHRGGMVARWLADQYLGINPEKSRSFQEWHLLRHIQKLGLPAPVPVVASVTRKGLLYRADLITQEISQARPLADWLLEGEIEEATWREVGHVIRQFHDKDIYHADLNARNILVGNEGEVTLIDFDKAALRYLNEEWKVANMMRLHRSLNKFKALNRRFHYYPEDWKFLLLGYEGRS